MVATRINTEKLTTVGQLRLKRTIITDPRIVRLYMTEKLYFDLNIIAQYAGVTLDELLRNMAKDYVKECNG
ncbi:hypothetical protein H7F33_07105 [Pedobacter sp. PAMC26386]|nr:hypothetical protein H7F33_07105 [Pedobacter sp. PAMC26386]